MNIKEKISGENKDYLCVNKVTSQKLVQHELTVLYV